jgi:hypothetical protein
MCEVAAPCTRKVSGRGSFLNQGKLQPHFKGGFQIRHLAVRILSGQPASAVSVGQIQFTGKRPRLPRVKGRLRVSEAGNDVHRRPYLANLADSLRSRIFNIRTPLGETWLARTETGSSSAVEYRRKLKFGNATFASTHRRLGPNDRQICIAGHKPRKTSRIRLVSNPPLICFGIAPLVNASMAKDTEAERFRGLQVDGPLD